MKLVFMGSPGFAVPTLNALHAAGNEIAAAYTQPAKPAGRGRTMRPCAVQLAAEALGVPVRTPATLRHPEAQADFAALAAEVAVVAAYGLILPPAMLAAFPRGCLNVHGSLLPRWRGASPMQAAIRAGDAQTGICIMRMEAGLDTGPVLLRQAVPIGPRTTLPELHDTLADLGATLVLRALVDWPTPVAQSPDGVTLAPRLTREDGRIDWTDTASAIDRLVRATTPWPGAWTTLQGETLKILACTPAIAQGRPGTMLDRNGLVACGQGALRLLRVQRAGRAAMDAAALLRGLPTLPAHLGD